MEPKSLLESMRWVEPVESPQAKYEREARRLASEALYERFTGNANGGTVNLPRTPTPAALEARDHEKAARAAEIAEGTKQTGAARLEIARLQGEIAALGPKIAVAERAALAQSVKDRNDAIAKEADLIARDRAQRGKRPLSLPELRSKAAEAIRRAGR